MKYLLINKHNIIKGVFDREVNSIDSRIIEANNDLSAEQLIGKKIGVMNPKEMKIAIICNWRTPCGISTYSQFLVESLKNHVADVKIFSEIETKADMSHDLEENVVRCWKRGESMKEAVDQIKAWKPDFVILQHEFGIFPKATHFLKLLQGIEHFPHAVVLHSVYENHLDKTICTSAIRNVIVHSEAAKAALVALGHAADHIDVISHGCLVHETIEPLWNIFQTPYPIVQFGFGFFYKGVDRAIEAIGHLKNSDPKFKDIFYCYLCSESVNSVSTHAEYHDYLESLIDKLSLHDNVAIIRKYHSEEVINNYLRTAKLALFPYVVDPSCVVYGASGAIRLAMANKIPVIASESPMFSDLEGIIPRPKSALELAQQIDKVFSNQDYKKKLLEKNEMYIRENTWDITANRYIEVVEKVMDRENYIEII